MNINASSLKYYLSSFLPIKIHELQQSGIKLVEWELAQDFAITFSRHGDALQYGGKKGDAGAIAGSLLGMLAIACFDVDENAAVLNEARLRQINQWIENLDAKPGQKFKPLTLQPD